MAILAGVPSIPGEPLSGPMIANRRLAPPPRSARLVLVTPSGDLLGQLPPVDVDTPWWQDAEAVVRAIRERDRLDVTVLRLLEGAGPPAGGLVTYLAQVAAEARPAADLEPWTGQLDEHPLRQAYARPGGPDVDLAWADDVLRRNGLQRSGAPEQMRTWNLSSLWRIPLPEGVAWLKVVPPFFAHEGALLERLAGGPVPPLLGWDGGRILMPEIPGDDLYGAPLPTLSRMVQLLVGLQRDWLGREAELLALGLPDWRPTALTEAIASVVERTADELQPGDRAELGRLVDGLPARFARVAEAGLGDALVHGDFHPGNVRGRADGPIVLLDWGDSGVGHPLLDQAAFLDRMAPDSIEPIRRRWRREWQRAVPGSDPDRAARRLAPVAAARQAVIYRRFLDNIEPAEHPYHASDPADWLTRATALLRAEREG